ncbi:hypothetical protein N9242_04680 [Vicingaceae bacterium]|nr:hypothetical protein [Vicingaceae bacterium]
MSLFLSFSMLDAQTVIDTQSVKSKTTFDMAERYTKKQIIKPINITGTRQGQSQPVIIKDVLRDDNGQPILPIELKSKTVLTESNVVKSK